MKQQIIIADYGMGNLLSVQKALEKVGFPARVSNNPEQLLKADKLIVPGVGGFPQCMENLEKNGLAEAIKSYISSGKAYLGICLGMQILMEESSEFGQHSGLGIFEGQCSAFEKSPKSKVPHMGWNSLNLMKNQGQERGQNEQPSKLLKGIENNSYVYFVHSFYVSPNKESTQKSMVAATTHYQKDFCSVIEYENIFATQFHPEKSQAVGLNLLNNFCEL